MPPALAFLRHASTAAVTGFGDKVGASHPFYIHAAAWSPDDSTVYTADTGVKPILWNGTFPLPGLCDAAASFPATQHQVFPDWIAYDGRAGIIVAATFVATVSARFPVSRRTRTRSPRAGRHSVRSMTLGGLDPAIGTAENYREWAREARGRSPAYDVLATLVADDGTILRFLGTLPPPKRQPNLLFAAARYLLGTPPDITALRDLVRENPAALAEVMLARRTQTNEPARCATLLPALDQLPPPLALIEVGASAGLTLLFDRYSYDYAGHLIAGSDPDAPTLRCAPRGPVPLPERIPAIAWRAGLDLNPLDVTDDDDVRWLSCLVWPGEEDRQERLAAAIASARHDPPAVHRGDLLSDLPALAARAPADATLVIFHSAVLPYVAPESRRRFIDTVRGLPGVWLSNEAPGVVPGISAPHCPGGPFLLIRDGDMPLAYTDGHGAWVQWLAG